MKDRKDTPQSSPAVGFLLRFALLYGLLILPWPQANRIYGGYFRWLGGAAFALNNGGRILYFEPAPARLLPLDTAIVVADPAQLDASGRGPVKMLGLDARGVGWVPTALLVALVVASPVSWRRRGGALLGGLLSIHAFILFSVGISIWNESAALAPFWKAVGDGLEETLITQMGPGFVAPVFFWIVFTFRRQDIAGLLPRLVSNRMKKAPVPGEG